MTHQTQRSLKITIYIDIHRVLSTQSLFKFEIFADSIVSNVSEWFRLILEFGIWNLDGDWSLVIGQWLYNEFSSVVISFLVLLICHASLIHHLVPTFGSWVSQTPQNTQFVVMFTIQGNMKPPRPPSNGRDRRPMAFRLTGQLSLL